MIQRYSTVAGVIKGLGDQARARGRCEKCERRDVTVYPLLALWLCAPCVVVSTGGTNGG